MCHVFTLGAIKICLSRSYDLISAWDSRLNAKLACHQKADINVWFPRLTEIRSSQKHSIAVGPSNSLFSRPVFREVHSTLEINTLKFLYLLCRNRHCAEICPWFCFERVGCFLKLQIGVRSLDLPPTVTLCVAWFSNIRLVLMVSALVWHYRKYCQGVPKQACADFAIIQSITVNLKG